MLALYERYICSIVKEYPQIFVDGINSLLQVTVHLNNCIGFGNLGDIPNLHENVKMHLRNMDDILQKFEMDRKQNFQYRMVRIYMTMVERLFIFIHATRSHDWKLHLSSTEELMRDISSMDRIKYSRMLPVYLAEMHGLEKTDPVVWKAFCDGEFAVQVRPIPFVALGMDHKGEQINKQFKIDGGIIGISRLGEISQSFKIGNGVTNDKQKHHQFTNAYTNRQNDMKIKLGEVLENYNLDFDKKEDRNLRNFVTNQIYPDNTQRDILQVETIGENRL